MTERETGNTCTVVASIDGDVIRLRRCAKLFIALGLATTPWPSRPNLKRSTATTCFHFACAMVAE